MVFRLDARLLTARAARMSVLAALLGLAGTACERTTSVVPVSWLAVVSLFDDTAAARQLTLSYHVRELSGTLGIDTLITRSARDTIVLDLPPATYSVAVRNLPPTCAVSRGLQQLVVVFPPPSTALARYFVLCRPALLLTTLTDGRQIDSLFTWSLAGPASRSGVIGSNDTLRLEGLPAGDYEVTLSHVAGNCVAVSDGGARQRLALDSAGGAALTFRVACSDPAQRPRVISFGASYHDRAAAFALRATDPQRDIERYVFDITDCAGSSVLPGGSRLRRGLTTGRTAGADTVLLAVGFDIGVEDALMAGRCASIRVADEFGNTTQVTELPLGTGPAGPAPVATSFNASAIGGVLRTDVQAFDPDGDFAGFFYHLRIRDGVFGPPDGTPDLALFNTAGYLAVPLPELTLGTLVQLSDIQAAIVFLIDRSGRFSRVEDSNVFQ